MFGDMSCGDFWASCRHSQDKAGSIEPPKDIDELYLIPQPFGVEVAGFSSQIHLPLSLLSNANIRRIAVDVLREDVSSLLF